MKRIVLAAILCLSFLPLFAQKDKALVKGKLVSEATGQPLADVEVELPTLKILQHTDPDGSFSFSQVPYGSYQMQVGNGFILSETVNISVDQEVVDIGEVKATPNEASTSFQSGQLPTVALEDESSSADDDGVSDQSVSGVLTASRDPFLSAAAYTFGPLRYQLRGYQRDQLDVFMNGIPMNDAESGFAIWGNWGGLNDVFRNQSVTFGLQPAEAGFGGLSGTTSLDASAAAQRKQIRVSYSLSNRTYNNRLMFTYSTGLMKNGWAFSVSGSKRWAQEGYIPGTFYDGYSYYLAISKKMGQKSFLHFITYGSPTQRGKAAPTTQEAMDIAGSNYYNPNWGYQDGKKRNARVNNTFQPTALLSYEYKPNANTILTLSAAYQQGFVGNSAIDWYNAQDPRPDYYRKLPSYYLYNPAGADPVTAAEVLEDLKSDPDQMQVDWGRLYEANELNVETVNGVTGKRSVYVIGQDRDDIRKMSFAANLQSTVGEHSKFFTGIGVVSQHTESYRKMLDLLGGDYYVNLNQFAERTYVGNNSLNQNDLNNPNGIIKVGDKYSYDYISNFMNAYWWGQGLFTFDKVDLFLSAKLGYNGFDRNGLFKNGLFPDDSQGKSDNQSFFTYGIKGGITYKIDGRNYLFVNGGVMSNAPTFDNTFISPRTRNDAIADAVTEKIKTIEGGYLLRSPALNGRLSMFVTDITDGTEIQRYYHEDYRTFINYVMRNVNTRNLGAELALQAKISPSFSATLVAAWMQAFYTSRPDISIYQDNDTTSKVSTSKAYMNNYYVASGPQTAITLGLNYRSPKYWYATVNVNYFDRNYVEVNPSRLTADAVDLMKPGSEEWHAILDQEKLPSAFTIDIFAGKSFLLSKAMKWLPYNSYLYLNVGVSNILNNKDMKTGGFEQLRFDYANANPERFPSKYFYAFGTNYFINLSLKF